MAALLGATGVAGAQAQSTSSPPAAVATPASPKPASPVPRTRIELPLAERQAMDKPSENKPSALTSADLVPSAADQTDFVPDERGPRIEERRTSNRVSEIRVTPGLGTPSYLIINREGRQPTSITEMSSGLSIPKFFSIDFGRPATNPAAPPPPPSR